MNAHAPYRFILQGSLLDCLKTQSFDLARIMRRRIPQTRAYRASNENRAAEWLASRLSGTTKRDDNKRECMPAIFY